MVYRVQQSELKGASLSHHGGLAKPTSSPGLTGPGALLEGRAGLGDESPQTASRRPGGSLDRTVRGRIGRRRNLRVYRNSIFACKEFRQFCNSQTSLSFLVRVWSLGAQGVAIRDSQLSRESPSVLPSELWAVEWSVAFTLENLLELTRFGINIS